MFDSTKLRVSAVQESSIWLELRPNRAGGLRVRFGRGTDVMKVVVTVPDSELRAAANGEPKTFQDGPRQISFKPGEDVIEVTFVGHLGNEATGGFHVRLSDFQMLVESAISARNDPTASLVVS